MGVCPPENCLGDFFSLHIISPLIRNIPGNAIVREQGTRAYFIQPTDIGTNPGSLTD